MKPSVTKGGAHADARGKLFFNNDFDATQVKRFYIIENQNTAFVRGWQGHKIEQRWFSAVQGSFRVALIEVDNWENPSKTLQPFTFELNADQLDVLHVPKGYISSIQMLESNSKLLVLADYFLGEIKDEYRFDTDYFQI